MSDPEAAASNEESTDQSKSYESEPIESNAEEESVKIPIPGELEIGEDTCNNSSQEELLLEDADRYTTESSSGSDQGQRKEKLKEMSGVEEDNDREKNQEVEYQDGEGIEGTENDDAEESDDNEYDNNEEEDEDEDEDEDGDDEDDDEDDDDDVDVLKDKLANLECQFKEEKKINSHLQYEMEILKEKLLEKSEELEMMKSELSKSLLESKKQLEKLKTSQATVEATKKSAKTSEMLIKFMNLNVPVILEMIKQRKAIQTKSDLFSAVKHSFDLGKRSKSANCDNFETICLSPNSTLNETVFSPTMPTTSYSTPFETANETDCPSPLPPSNPIHEQYLNPPHSGSDGSQSLGDSVQSTPDSAIIEPGIIPQPPSESNITEPIVIQQPPSDRNTPEPPIDQQPPIDSNITESLTDQPPSDSSTITEPIIHQPPSDANITESIIEQPPCDGSSLETPFTDQPACDGHNTEPVTHLPTELIPETEFFSAEESEDSETCNYYLDVNRDASCSDERCSTTSSVSDMSSSTLHSFETSECIEFSSSSSSEIESSEDSPNFPSNPYTQIGEQKSEKTSTSKQRCVSYCDSPVCACEEDSQSENKQQPYSRDVSSCSDFTSCSEFSISQGSNDFKNDPPPTGREDETEP